METSKIKVCGQEVSVGYCYATEIAFHNYTGVSVEKFDPNNPQHAVYLIMAAIFSYYNAKEHQGEAHELTDESLLYESKPDEIIQAFNTVLGLRLRWYGVEAPGQDEDHGADGKN